MIDGRADEAELIQLLPRVFRVRAAEDWSRWLATFSTVLWKLAQPHAPQPATMAEQLLVAALVRFAERDVVEMAADGVVQLDVPPGGLRLSWWLEIHLEDVDHELLYQAALDGIDDASTDYQYGFGRMDYEGMFSVFNELNSRYHGIPHPMAPLQVSPSEAAAEQRAHAAVEQQVAALLARAALAGEPVFAFPQVPPDTNVTVFRAALLLGISATWDEEVGVVPLPESLDGYDRER